MVESDEEGWERVHNAIYDGSFGIKAHSNPVDPRAAKIVQQAVAGMAFSGAQAVILGCTELPLAISKKNSPLPLLDPAEICARRVISMVAPEKLRPAK
jgi:aspartate racemase